MAVTRLTSNSRASESRLTELVSKKALILRAMVKTAALIESHAKRVNLMGEVSLINYLLNNSS